MTSLIFGHDHFFYRGPVNQIYSPGGLPASAWDRYLEHFSSLTVVGRDGGMISNTNEGMVQSSRRSVNFKLLPNLTNPFKFIKNYIGVREDVCKLVSEHDAVVARLGSRFGMMLVSEARRQNKPYLIELVGCPRDALWYHGKHLYKSFIPYKVFAVRKAVKGAPFVLYVTEKFLQGRYPCGGKTIGCSNVHITSQRVINARSVGVDRCGGIRIGLIGNYSARYKGIADAIKSLPAILLKYPSARLEIVGGGDASEYISLAEKLNVEASVKFCGRLPAGDAIYNWLDSLDVYLQPSHTEGLPRSLIEAMSRGCPAIGTSVGGIPELLPAKLLVGKGNHKQLAEKVIELISSDEFYRQVSEQVLLRSEEYSLAFLSEKRRHFYGEFYEFVNSRRSSEAVFK